MHWLKIDEYNMQHVVTGTMALNHTTNFSSLTSLECKLWEPIEHLQALELRTYFFAAFSSMF